MPTKQQRAASSSSSSSSSTKLSRGSVSSLRAAAVSLAAILVLAAVPLTHSAPVKPWQTTEDRRQLLSQASDVLGEICFLMLVQKSKELKGQENNKKPLLRLVSHLYTRRERGISVQAELEGPGGIQSRGYFLYRPRNGRRALEYE
ncbi:neuromedin-U isoform X4 [Phyllopteryx taeniolatus]|uniref:neuromedin-U isoform X4 n=1 Tax=Phyllopteryx taeniolatus TaxID=161469 RepID=UPI002AD2CDAB|nr:neuromedin-U isoform X4 [Phyllopteryx taeniolatus]